MPSRHEELSHDCVVSPHVFDRLRDCVVPYQHCLETAAGQRHVHLYLAGLLSHLERKNAEEIAPFVDVERLVLQEFIGTAPWDHRLLVKVLVGEVVAQLGGRVSKVEMTVPIALIDKALFPSIATFETPPTTHTFIFCSSFTR
jgi:hypothetical protein